MTEEGQPVPQRIGDAERDRAVELLREHHAVGRLTTDEFDERLGTALSARTSLDLDPLFADLPGPRPGQGLATTSSPFQAPPWQQPVPGAGATPARPDPRLEQGRKTAVALITTLIWPITILAITFGLGWSDFWWLVFVPIIVTSVLGKNEHGRREDERRRIEREQAELDRRRRAIGD